MAEATSDLGRTPAAEAPRSIPGAWHVMALALAACLLGMVAAPRWLEQSPHLIERLPTALQEGARYLEREPDWTTLPRGPLLDAVRARGELVVGVRQYARPAPPSRPTPPEPDAFDVSLARYLAERLQVSLRVVGLPADTRGVSVPGVDLVVAGTIDSGPYAVPTAYTGGAGALVTLRGSDYRAPNDLAGRGICVAQGSPYARPVTETLGAQARVYASSIRAVAAFMGGECQALAEDALVVARLMGLPEWRFYRRLHATLLPDNTHPQIVIRQDDPRSAAWLDRAVRHWKIGGALATARAQRAGDIAYEASQLGDGLVCHS